MNQAITFLFLALRMGAHSPDSLKRLPDLIQESIDMVDSQAIALSSSLTGRDDLYCLGYGLTYPIALEGEVTYAHCEGMLSTEFKHGAIGSNRRLPGNLCGWTRRCSGDCTRSERDNLSWMTRNCNRRR
jgi:hypothetical protein